MWVSEWMSEWMSEWVREEGREWMRVLNIYSLRTCILVKWAEKLKKKNEKMRKIHNCINKQIFLQQTPTPTPTHTHTHTHSSSSFAIRLLGDSQRKSPTNRGGNPTLQHTLSTCRFQAPLRDGRKKLESEIGNCDRKLHNNGPIQSVS